MLITKINGSFINLKKKMHKKNKKTTTLKRLFAFHQFYFKYTVRFFFIKNAPSFGNQATGVTSFYVPSINLQNSLTLISFIIITINVNKIQLKIN